MATEGREFNAAAFYAWLQEGVVYGDALPEVRSIVRRSPPHVSVLPQPGNGVAPSSAAGGGSALSPAYR